MTALAITGLGPLSAGYNGFIVDLWGTLHDGYRLLPGAGDCLARLRHQGKVCLLSNSPRRNAVEVARLAAMGLGRDGYDGLLTAGEFCRARLADDLGRGAGRRYCVLGKATDDGLLDGRSFRRVAGPGEADLVLIGDPPPDLWEVETWDPRLQPMLERGLPLVCPNPDLWSSWGGQRQAKPGAVAQRYTALGGRVLWYGKPGREIFDAALAQVGLKGARVLVVGDNVATDIAGAAAAGLDACLVRGDEKADDLPADAANVVAMIPSLRW